MINREDKRRRLISKRDASVIVFAFLIAGILRAIVAYHGGIWADEGSFLEVIAAPSWSGMISFLQLHESHPPLFYLLMRAWARVSGGGDVGLMLMPVLIGAAIVPAMYLAGSALFSRRAGLIGAFLSATSAS
ncbi:MAG TPA: glycosyltransferase family 39 protein, partial [Gemmatimonadaceae bacterium]|nr:glycosyltransferase family 39 protein [Gemmatimonadaceae bacterium]